MPIQNYVDKSEVSIFAHASAQEEVLNADQWFTQRNQKLWRGSLQTKQQLWREFRFIEATGAVQCWKSIQSLQE